MIDKNKIENKIANKIVNKIYSIFYNPFNSEKIYTNLKWKLSNYKSKIYITKALKVRIN